MALLRRVFIVIISILFSLTSATNSSSNILSNNVDSTPKKSKQIEIYLLDLSRSVEETTVLEGLKSIREKIANVYGDGRSRYNSPATSYFYWVPIRGVNDRKDFYPLFSPKVDFGLWLSVRNSVGGRSNQIKALTKIRTQGGLWRDLITKSSLSRCTNDVQIRLAEPGLFGSSLLRTAKGVCDQAVSTRNNIAKLQNGVASYLSGRSKTNGGSDIFGVIARLDDEAQSKSGLGQYSKVNLIFVSDGLNNTPSIDLRRTLLNNASSACRIGTQSARGMRYDPIKYTVRMYGLGEGRTGDSTRTELLRVPLKEFWSCYWKQKGILNPEFGQLDELGIG